MTKRRAPRPPISSHCAPGHHSANHCRAVVLVDGTSIRKKIKKDYEKALRDLDNSRRQLDQFHQTDLPQFTRWLNANFGALLTEIRELSQKIAVDEELVFQVHSEVMFGGGSYARAYERVMELRQNPEPLSPPPTGNGEPEEEADPFVTRSDAQDFDGEDDPLDELFDQLFDPFGFGERPRKKRTSRSRHHNESASPPHSSSRL